jgi:hypothetical protein
MTPERLAEIRAKAAEGPWWWSNTSYGAPHLFGKGHRVVMTFARMGMQSAQPVFRDRTDYRLLENAGKENLHTFPDAVFIADAPAAIDELLAELDQLRAQVAAAWDEGHQSASDVECGYINPDEDKNPYRD